VFDKNEAFRKAATSPDDALLLGHGIELMSQNIYGRVSSGHLILNGFTKRLFRSNQSISFADKCFFSVRYDEKEAEEPKMDIETLIEFEDDSGYYQL
jgi:hypothetical protein